MSLFFGRKSKITPKAVIVGLDGVPHSLLKELIKKDRIPCMASIFKKGYFGPMTVSIPEISSVSWSSFMTGTQSGEHGIFGFMDLLPGTYKMYFPNFLNLKAPILWDDLAAMGKKSVVINMPSTYPARKINGVLISGFVAVDINKAVYPSSLITPLNQLGYRIDIDLVRARNDLDFLFYDLNETLDARQRVLDLLWHQVDWDLFIIVLTGTDRLMHFLFDAYENENHPYHSNFLRYFENVDSFVGNVYSRFMAFDGFNEDIHRFYMLSDHGFTKIKAEVYLNRWLKDRHYLKFINEDPQTIMDIGPDSTAFALDPSRLYVNLKGKYPLGNVDAPDYERVRYDLKQDLENLMYNDNRTVLNKVFLKEDLYYGPFSHMGPDLVVLPHYGFDFKGKVNSDKVFNRTNLTGMHTHDDAFFFSSDNTVCTSIFQLKNMIIESLSLTH